MKIIHIVGARPQFIKCLPVQKAIISLYPYVEDILVHTGQHYDYMLSEVFFNDLGLKSPKYHLGVGSGFHGEQTGKIIERVERILKQEKPDMVIVYGDTNSTLGGALAASKLHIPIAHVEAGLRSFNRYMPEEINRVLTDHMSSYLFCPTQRATLNLKNEGFLNILNNGKLVDSKDILGFSNLGLEGPIVVNVGDVMYDVILDAIEIAKKNSRILSYLKLNAKEYHLLTLHRQENTDNRMKLLELFHFVSEASTTKKIIFPAHPRTRKAIDQFDINLPQSIILIDPIGYFDMLLLLMNSSMVFTDSGGLQKEAYWLKVPCITLRDETEWIETVESGWNVLYKDYKGFHKFSENCKNLYGDGKAGLRIAQLLCYK